MKTFKQFLLEETNPPLKDLIEDECKGFLARGGHEGFLYRGMNNLGDFHGRYHAKDDSFAVYRKSVRKDRMPMSTNKVLSRVVDDWFEEHLGFRARSGAVFCFGEGGRHSAHGYGGNHTIVFPVGKFSFAWSPHVHDLYHHLDKDIMELPEGSHRIAPKAEYLDRKGRLDPEKINDYMQQFKFTNNHLDKAIQSNSEIMIDCDEVLLVPYGSFIQVADVKEALGIKSGDD